MAKPRGAAASAARRATSTILRGGAELLLTAGVLMLLFTAWHLWWTNLAADEAQASAVAETVREWSGQDDGAVETSAAGEPIRAEDGTGAAAVRAPGAEEAIRAEAPGATAEAAPETGTGNGAGSGTVQGPGAEQAARDGGVPQAAGPALDSGVWGILYVPRFGPDYAKPIAEGVDPDVLDSVGIGHYPGTQRPGQLGNVGLAGHRQTHGGVFWHMDRLGPGDRAYLQTREGVYTYVYRSTEIVPPSGIQVLYPVPGDSGAVPTRRLLTLTTCHPPFTTDLRMVVHLEQGSFVPAGTTAPPEVRDVVRRAAGLEGA